MTDEEFKNLKQELNDLGEIGGYFDDSSQKWIPQLNGKDVSGEERDSYISKVKIYREELLKRETI
jgi:hypothetical protein